MHERNQSGMASRRQAIQGIGVAAWAAVGSARGAIRHATPIRVGQIGVAHGHATKLAIYRQSNEYEVVGLAEPDAALRAKASKNTAFQDVPWMSVDQLLATPGLQAVLIETSPRDSLRYAEQCIEAGLHVHLDKPAGESYLQYDRILRRAHSKQLMVQMGYMYRYNPGFLRLRELIAQQALGQIFEIHAVMSKVVDPANRKQHAQYPGGMMFELGCHLIDLVISLHGEPEQVSSFSRPTLGHDDGLADNMLAVLTYPNAIASIKSSAVEIEGSARRHLVVCGTQGTYHLQPLDQPKAKVTLARPHQDLRAGENLIEFEPFTRYVADAAEMARIIRGEQEAVYTHTHDRCVQRTVLQASGMSLEA